MGSSFFGVSTMRNHERSSSSSLLSSSSRKGKKSGSDKPKLPQRGLGVAQLEQIRLRSQMGCGFPPPSLVIQEELRLQGVPYGGGTQPSTSSPYAHHPPNFMMVYGDHQRENLRYQDSEPSMTSSRWNPNGSINIQDRSNYPQPGSVASSRHHFNHFEDSGFDLLTSMGASCQNLDSDDHDEVDLELRLSI